MAEKTPGFWSDLGLPYFVTAAAAGLEVAVEDSVALPPSSLLSVASVV